MEKQKEKKPGLFLALFWGTGVALLLLLLLTLVIAGLIWGGVVPAKSPSLVLSLCACICAFVGGRVAVKHWKGGTMVAGGLTGAILCGVLTAVCLGTTGTVALPGLLFATLALVLAGGCLAGLGKKA